MRKSLTGHTLESTTFSWDLRRRIIRKQTYPQILFYSHFKTKVKVKEKKTHRNSNACYENFGFGRIRSCLICNLTKQRTKHAVMCIRRDFRKRVGESVSVRNDFLYPHFSFSVVQSCHAISSSGVNKCVPWESL